jgi:dCTP deaminase
MIKSDRWIRRMAQEHDMINPYSEKQVSDCRPETFRRAFVRDRERRCRHRPAEFVCVGEVGGVLQDSARCADHLRGQVHLCALWHIVNVTPFEPEWEGFVTFEISNTTPLPAKIYANEGQCQILFFQSDEVCETSYKDRKGKYQAQKGIVLPKL